MKIIYLFFCCSLLLFLRVLKLLRLFVFLTCFHCFFFLKHGGVQPVRPYAYTTATARTTPSKNCFYFTLKFRIY